MSSACGQLDGLEYGAWRSGSWVVLYESFDTIVRSSGEWGLITSLLQSLLRLLQSAYSYSDGQHQY